MHSEDKVYKSFKKGTLFGQMGEYDGFRFITLATYCVNIYIRPLLKHLCERVDTTEEINKTRSLHLMDDEGEKLVM